MARNAEISIIVPVYKVEKYIRECLDSIRSQSYADWECVLVDDGSPDGSGRVCDDYSVLDPRFRVVHCKNGGVSAARNIGIEMAKGKYICFVDPDDVIYDRYLEVLRGLIEKYDADVAQVGYELLYTTYKRKRELVGEVTVLNHRRVTVELLRDKVIQSYLWNKLFRREVIDTPFPVGKVYEDFRIMTVWAKNIRKMVISPEVLYGYRQRAGSIVNSNSVRYRMEYLEAVMQRVEAFEAEASSLTGDVNPDSCLWESIVRTGKSMARDSKSRRKDFVELGKICQGMNIPSMKTLGLKMWWRAHILRSHPVWFGKLMKTGGKFSSHRYKRRRHLFE